MKKYFLKKRIFAVIFVLAVFSFAIYNAYNCKEELSLAWTDEEAETIDAKVFGIEETINETMFRRDDFIEAYSYMNLLLYKNEINNFTYIKDENGYLYYSSFFREDTDDEYEYALRVKRLKDYANEKGSEVLFIVPPDKYIPFEIEFEIGLSPNDVNPNTDELLLWLTRLDVETIDYRKLFPNEELSYDETFFKTDHHWTVPAAYEATKVLIESLNERYEANLELNKLVFEESFYPSSMVGSMGKTVGKSYSGIDDFVFIEPLTDDVYTYTSWDNISERESYGQVTETLINMEVLEETISDKYSAYMRGLSYYDHIINESNPEGPKVLFIRDSYASPMITFIAPLCSEIEAVWCLEDNDGLNIEEMVRNNTYDYIIIEVYPYNISDEAFNYFREGE